MTALIDTNILVYRFDPRDSAKQRIARELAARRAPTRSYAAPTSASSRVDAEEKKVPGERTPTPGFTTPSKPGTG